MVIEFRFQNSATFQILIPNSRITTSIASVIRNSSGINIVYGTEGPFRDCHRSESVDNSSVRGLDFKGQGE